MRPTHARGKQTKADCVTERDKERGCISGARLISFCIFMLKFMFSCKCATYATRPHIKEWCEVDKISCFHVKIHVFM